jgi:SSS family solute:Na+ symporter
MPLAKFNSPPDFNFVGIFWQDGIAGSIGFLFLNMGLIMRFMATKSVNEGRKAAAFNVLFMLPISAIVVGNAGWLGKAISVVQPDVVPPNTDPDQIFVVVANIVSTPGLFGFIMAALTAALMSTVDTLINATAAIYINDIHRPIKVWLKKYDEDERTEDKHELVSARFASVAITILGVLAVLVFRDFPTVYEAHGFFHSTLTPPLVVAVFLGIFWKKFTPAAVITTFLGGVLLMILGANYPGLLISPFDQGIKMDPAHPYTYIRALYNLFVCMAVAVASVLTTKPQQNFINRIRANKNHKVIMYALAILTAVIFVFVTFNSSFITIHSDSSTEITIMLILAILVAALVSLTTTYFVKYDEAKNTEGLTAYTISKAKEMFKGSKVNEEEGEKVKVKMKLKSGDEDIIYFSKSDMVKMKANVGDLVYLSDARKWLGGLKSIHSTFGEPHNEDGIVYVTDEHLKQGQFVKGKLLLAEKEM